MESGKQKRAAIMARRREKRSKAKIDALLPASAVPRPVGSVSINKSALVPNNGYDVPTFVQYGYYMDLAFTCRDCGARHVWKAEQQQWWYEMAKGAVYSTAVRCFTCRRERSLAHGGTPKRIRVAA
ncbi:hypothetical protein FNU76_11920 [Chitinimonas arctica]|uniref:Probable zinc-binding domain-containing protein n=1 Tax=Chitinimonas arctica TaxID=2594795 RepID=A0A516SFZ2_9NEIS|nr:zinc-ribbon domain containing protein [Chitinimonas arctica]QDQ27010.1 hypothetical protein FNU76_11920 [Chitinimonas arctica]